MCRLLYVAIDRVMGYTYAIFGTYKKLNMIEIDKSMDMTCFYSQNGATVYYIWNALILDTY